MNESEATFVSGEVETIVIKPEPIEPFIDSEDFISLEDEAFYEETSDEQYSNCFITSSGEVLAINEVENTEDVIQTPFYLENYFKEDSEDIKSLNNSFNEPETILEVDRVTCYECDIVFCTEHKLLEHLMAHINIYRMGCDVCNMDLNLEEKFQLHMMAVTWQSIYYCDFCRKSCAGVVRSKSQPPPPGKTYMCHDCEIQAKEDNMLIADQAVKLPVKEDIKPSQGCKINFLSSKTEVLKCHKEKPKSDIKLQNCDCCETKNALNNEMKNKLNSVKLPLSDKMKNENCKNKSECNFNRESKITSDINEIKNSYKCSYCPLVFTRQCKLLNHLNTKHELYKLKYICKVCRKEFSELKMYKNHISCH